MSERRLWQRMREGIAPFCFAQRIENLTGDGAPDVWLCSKATGQGAWTELKCRMEMPVRPSTPIFNGDHGLRPDQVAWIYGRASAGANIYILGQGGDRLWLVHGRYARELATMSSSSLSKACDWEGLARRTDWQSLMRKIFERD